VTIATNLRATSIPFIVSSELQGAANGQGYRVTMGESNGWQFWQSASAPGEIALGSTGVDGPWFLSVQHNGVARELEAEKAEPCARGHAAAFAFPTRDALCDGVRRAYELALSLPTLPLEKFKAEVARIGATERDALIRQRVGQDIFREALLTYWRGTCPLTGITDPELLRASHIIRWSECPNDEERLYVHNGLLLSSLWDAAFDSGLITFDDNGKVMPARALSRAARAEMRIEDAPPVILVDATRERMEWHRLHVFQKLG
jgi:hypothetical protein